MSENINTQIENNFIYHAPTKEQQEIYPKIRAALKSAAYVIEAECPNSREKSVAMTHLETAMFWANASIARNQSK